MSFKFSLKNVEWTAVLPEIWDVMTFTWRHCNNVTFLIVLVTWTITRRLFILSHHVKTTVHDNVIKWKYFTRYWPFVQGIHRSPVNSPYKAQWLGALMFSLICAWTNGWINNRGAGELRRHRAHYDVTVMVYVFYCNWFHFASTTNAFLTPIGSFIW